jgi:tRNA A-37 threonylcarbamoyl transferase component Bud32
VTIAPGSLFAGYRIEAVAGRGGMGIVYRALQEGLGRTVALKLIAPELASDPQFRARFGRESRLAASLDHPHVIPVYEAGEEDGSLFIAMRWVDGPDLRERVAGEGPLSLEGARALVTQLAGALEAAHALGLVHRDVKPANVLLAGGDVAAPHAYLSDFGLALSDASSDRLTRSGGVLGTAAYSSPEQIEGRVLDGRADVYALACVLFFALSGRPPFRRDTELATAWAQVHDQPPTLRSVGVEVPAALELALSRALAKDPHERPATTMALAEQVALAVSGMGEPPSAARMAERGVEADGPERGVGDQNSATRLLGGASRPGAEGPTVRLQRPPSPRRRLLPWLVGLLTAVAAGGALAAVLVDDGSDSGGARTTSQARTHRAAPAPASPAEPDPRGDVVRCANGDCRQRGERMSAPVEDADCGTGGSWQRLDGGGDPALFACRDGSSTTLVAAPDLVGARLDRAEDFLDEHGVDHDTDGGGTFGIVVRDNWTVCATDPLPGRSLRGAGVTLQVDRSC